MALSQAIAAPIDEIVEAMELAPRNGFHAEPRCRVCRDDEIRTKVNDMLVTGASYAYIVRALGEDNSKCDRRDRVTVDSVRNHCRRHFPIQQVARATYRDIVERRAQENRVDFVNGVATALVPQAFYEVVMNEAFRRLVDGGTEVSVDTGLRAAEKLQSFLDRRSEGPDVAEMMVQVDRIIKAVKSTVPESMWPEILSKIKGEDEASQPLEDDADVFDPADDAFDGDLDELDR